MIRKKKLYVRPKKLYEKKRIENENFLLQKYALKNKREVWKSLAKVNYFRSRAKSLARSSLDEQKNLFLKLNNIGIPANSIAEVLALKLEDILERRLPTIVFKKGMSSTVKQARQLVVHKKILINGRVVNVPSYLVLVSEESSLALNQPMKQNINKVSDKPEEKNNG